MPFNEVSHPFKPLDHGYWSCIPRFAKLAWPLLLILLASLGQYTGTVSMLDKKCRDSHCVIRINVPNLTHHANSRMQRRAISEPALEATIAYGRMVHTRGAVIHAIGRNEIAEYAEDGVDLSEFHGIQVVCAQDGSVLTVYRNRDFRRLRPGLGRRRHKPLAT